MLFMCNLKQNEIEYQLKQHLCQCNICKFAAGIHLLKIVHTCLICRVELVYIAYYLVFFYHVKKKNYQGFGITIVACYVDSMLINVVGQS